MPRYQQNSQDGLFRAQPPPYFDGAQYQQDGSSPPPSRDYPSYTEHSSLLGQSFRNVEPAHRKAIGLTRGLIVMLLLLSLFSFAMIGYISNTVVNQEWHDRLARDVSREENQRAIRRKEWNAEVHQHEERRAKMHQEQRDWDQEWHDRLARDVSREENQRAIRREEWNAEVHQHEERRAKMHQEQRDWDREAREKADEERRRKEEENRQRESITWSGLGPSSHCLRYGVREYIAILTNVPLGFNAVEECWKKSIEIHGKDWMPTSCEDQGICGHVTGHWKVDHNEGGCSPWWSYFKDKGCVQPGIRRHEAPLENLQSGDNWQDMCSTTPANINGIHYDGPTSCVDWGKYGKWGIWLINDNSCW